MTGGQGSRTDQEQPGVELLYQQQSHVTWFARCLIDTGRNSASPTLDVEEAGMPKSAAVAFVVSPLGLVWIR